MTFTNLVFEGSSSKIYCYLGVIEYLEKHEVLSTIKNIVGTSSGSIISLLLTLGYSSKEIKDLIYSVNVKDFSNTNVIHGAFNFVKRYGYLDTSKYTDWLKKVIAEKTGNGLTTFEELYNLTGKNLIVTGTCINKRETHFYTKESNGNMPVYKAIEISTALPFLFPSIKWGEDILVDGGVLENFPIHYIRFDNTYPNSRKELVKYHYKKGRVNPNTLGVKVTTEIEKKDQFSDKIANVIEYGTAVFNTLITQIERTSVKKGYYDNIIEVIISETIDNFSLVLTDGQKDYLYSAGYSAAESKLGLS